jgi:signal transduction histidine kinase
MTSETLTSEELDRLITSHPPALDFASESPLLRQLASVDRRLLAGLMTEQRYTPGEFVFREGDSGDATYLIWSGRAVVLKGSLQSLTILGYRGPGEIIGEMALLDDRPRSASIAALESLRLLRISREGFRQLLISVPAIGMSIMESLSIRLRESDTDRATVTVTGRKLVRQVSELQAEKQELLELERLRQETSDFLVHDLRNPLGIIGGVIGMLEIVLPEDVLQANRELLDTATAASGRMQRLIDSLLDVTRLDAGEAKLELTEINLGTLAQQVIERIAPTLRKRAISLLSTIPADLPPIFVDEERIDRVLANLLDNAVKYTRDGGKITIAARLQDEYVRISVTDSGPGIPPKDRERVFERYIQAGDQTGRRGFGLGLTFCRLAVEAHGGRIWVESGDQGVGSRFVFTLPLEGRDDESA